MSDISGNTQQNDHIDSQQFNLDQMVKQYVEQHKPTLCILTPCYGATCFVNYMCCLLKTKDLLAKYNVKLKIEFCKNDSLVSRARNNLIALAMSDPEVTHIMFIDNDITWDPVNILKLLIANKPLIGGIYPLKKYNWNKITNDHDFIKNAIHRRNASQMGNIMDEQFFVQNILLNYNVNHKDNTIKIDKNLSEVKHLPTGFMMLKRGVIEKMSHAYSSTKYTDDINFLPAEANKYAYALFDCGVENDHYMSEDWLFCSRWSKLGGKIYIDVSINLSHTGIEDYHGSYVSSLI